MSASYKYSCQPPAISQPGLCTPEPLCCPSSPAKCQGSPEDTFLLGEVSEKEGRTELAGETMVVPTTRDKQGHQRSLHSNRNKRAKGTAWGRNKYPAAQLPYPLAAPVIYEAVDCPSLTYARCAAKSPPRTGTSPPHTHTQLFTLDSSGMGNWDTPPTHTCIILHVPTCA